MGNLSKFDPTKHFARASTTPVPRIIARIAGEVGTGKTHFALGAPGPILVQTLDQGLEGVIEPYAQSKEIFVASYDMGLAPGDEVTQETAIAIQRKYTEDYEKAIASRYFRTILQDRETDFWSISVFADTGSEKVDAFGAASGKDWTKIKAKIRRLYAMAKATNINLLVTQGMRNEWAKGPVNPRTGKATSTPTGNRLPEGMDDVDGQVNICLDSSRVDIANAPSQFFISVGKCRGVGARGVQGQTFEIVGPGVVDEDGNERPEFGFVQFAELVFPETSAEDWV